jgi:TonB family protein
VIRPREHELVWYSFRNNLPEVSPPEMSAQRHSAELKNPAQTLVSNPKSGERGLQMIWRPLPQIKVPLEMSSPNILAFRLPLIEPLTPGPPQNLFVPPRPRPRQLADPRLPPPPKIQEMRQIAVTAASFVVIENGPKPREFVLPAPRPQRRAAVQALEEAPRISTALRSERVPLLAENTAAVLANKPQARRFVPPVKQAVGAVVPVALPDAPRIAAQSANGAGPNPAIPGAANRVNPPKPRESVPPRAGVGRTGGTGVAPLLEDAPTVNAPGMPSANVNVAVVGLNPTAKLAGPLPESSRDAKFSVGPDADAGGGGDGSASRTALSVPGLLIRGGTNPERSANSLLVARASPTSRETLDAAMKAAGGRIPADPPAAEIRRAPPPDVQFGGRDVYTLAVQMPNITSYVGSWIMWFAERTPQEPRGAGGLRPPVPLHKVDPKYDPGAVNERVEGKVQVAGVIRADGRVELVRILKSVDPRLDQSAEQALLKWKFEPAWRNGGPVEMDLVAEIPFLLAPQVER